MEEHLCHAKGCKKPVKPSFLMCFRHWIMVPRRLRTAVLNTYRPGQEVTKDPSYAYIIAAQAAIEAVRGKENGV
jgi:hypothetical protein